MARRLRRIRRTLLRWRAGWVEFTRHHDFRGYRELAFRQRLVLDHRVLREAVCSRGFWRAFFLLAVLAAVAQIVAWQLDLRGWWQEAAAALPPLAVAPWVARGRRRHLKRLLGRKSV